MQWYACAIFWLPKYVVHRLVRSNIYFIAFSECIVLNWMWRQLGYCKGVVNLRMNPFNTNREGELMYWRNYIDVITAGRKTNVNSNYIHLRIQFVRRSKHTASVIKTSKLMQYREIIGVCSEVHTKYKNILCWQNVEFLVASAVCRKVAISCPSVRPHGTTRLPLNGLSWNLIFAYFSKTCQ
jgi:hypothetical protein